MNGTELRQARKAAGITQETLADRLGITTRHIKRLEAGETPIRETIARLAGLLLGDTR